MADIHQVITLGLGTPSDIPHFLLMGLTPEGSLPPPAVYAVTEMIGTYTRVTEMAGTYDRETPLTGTV